MRTIATQAQIMMKEHMVKIFHLIGYYLLYRMKNKNMMVKNLRISVSFFTTTGYENITQIGMTIPAEIIDKIFKYEGYILMKDYLPMYKHVLQDIEQVLKIILTDRDWHKPCYWEINYVFHLQFPWKQDWIQQPLEGAALYVGRGRIVSSKRVSGERNYFLHNRHPYYQTIIIDWVQPTQEEAKLVNHKYFHR